MKLKFCVLGSGSTGNCALVASERTVVLVDAGLSCREICRRIGSAGFRFEDICAVCITHEHYDHISGLATLQKRHNISLYANTATVEALVMREKCEGLKWAVFTTGHPFEIGDLTIEPFTVPHDSYDPVGFVVRTGQIRLGIVTDIGMPTSLVREKLGRCSALIVESNHDEKMLEQSNRPWSLKQRIAGRQGHLSNSQACRLVADVAGPSLRMVILAHLSRECNHPDLAIAAMKTALEGIGRADVAIVAASPCEPTPVFELNEDGVESAGYALR